MAIYIEPYKEEIDIAPVNNFKYLDWYYDEDKCIIVGRIYVEKDLQVNGIYQFTYEDNDDSNVYIYLILKKEDDNIYYMTKYYDKLVRIKKKSLGPKVKICNIKEELGIDVDKINPTYIDFETYLKNKYDEFNNNSEIYGDYLKGCFDMLKEIMDKYEELNN